jgi:hypothetical protein
MADGSGGPLLTAVVEGDVPVPARRPHVRWRTGIDLNPLAVTDRDQMAWLEALVWPEDEQRRARLAEAVDIARSEPPRLVRGDLMRALPAVLADAPATPVVFHSAVVVYLEPPDRAAFVEMMTGLVRDGACHWVSNEGPRVLPGIEVPPPPVPDRFLLCVDGAPVAWTHGHGRTLRWL